MTIGQKTICLMAIGPKSISQMTIGQKSIYKMTIGQKSQQTLQVQRCVWESDPGVSLSSLDQLDLQGLFIYNIFNQLSFDKLTVSILSQNLQTR